MTLEELSKLKQGDVVRHESTGAGYIVLSNRAGVPTVVRSIELHNGSEWSHVYTPTPVKVPKSAGLSFMDIILELERLGWIFDISKCEWTSPNGSYKTRQLQTAWEQRHFFKKRETAIATERPSLTVKSPAYLPSAFVMQDELHAAGWKRVSYEKWTDPAGDFFHGPVAAWKIMRRRRVDAVTAAGARSTSPPVKSFQEARAALHAAGWKNVYGRVWLSPPSGCHFDGTKAMNDDGTCNAS